MTVVDFDPLDASFTADPVPTYAAIRNAGGIAWNDRLQAWLVVGYADCLEVLRNPTVFVSGPRGSRSLPAHVLSVQLLDPPDHAPVRKLLAAAMNAQDMAALSNSTRDATISTIATLADAGPFDFMDVARTVALGGACRLAGCSTPDVEWFFGISEAIVEGMDSGLNPAAYEPSVAAKTILADWIREAMGKDGDTGVFHYVAEQDCDAESDLIVGSLRVIFHSAFETTAKLTGLTAARVLQSGGFAELARHNLDIAMGELVRFEAPVTAESRTCAQATTIAGQVIDAGETVIALIGAANRDPALFEDPDRLDLDRQPNPHMTFGRGPHGCPGARYAMRQVTTILGAVSEEFAELMLDEKPVYKRHATLRGLDRLTVSLPRRSLAR